MIGWRDVRRRLIVVRKGGPALEFALMAPVFVGMLLFAFEILYAIAAKSIVDTALETSSRAAVTGGATPTDTASRLTQFNASFYNVSDPMISRARLTLGVAACATAEILTNSPNACRANDPGATGEIVRFNATYRHEFLAPSAVCSMLHVNPCPSLTMSAQIVRRNEPF